jgi:hypothetical protein
MHIIAIHDNRVFVSSVILLVVSLVTTALGQNVYADEEQFIVRVHATGYDDDAGKYKITKSTCQEQ